MSNIPKVIHYCWFGRGEVPKLEKKCIETWKKILPDYTIIEWNEDNFNINCNEYVREAYEAKKYAFVSDYARLYVLYNYGGIYMDTDMEVVKSLDIFLENNAFVGFENDTHIQTGIMACKKGNKLFKEFLDYYNEKKFFMGDGKADLTANVRFITDICKKYNLKLNNTIQTINGLTVYPRTYFCPLSYTKEKYFTNNTYTIHHFAGSWVLESEKKEVQDYIKYRAKKEFLCKYMSEKSAYIILDLKWILKNKMKNIKVGSK